MEKAVLFRAEKLDNLLIFKAHYHTFQFSRHSHEDFALGLIEEGIQCFSYRGSNHTAPQGSMITVNPDEIHDGKSADKRPYRYRLLFIPSNTMQEIGNTVAPPKSSQHFLSPVTHDRELAGRLAQLFTSLESPLAEDIEIHTAFFSFLGDLLLRHTTVRGRHFNHECAPGTIMKTRSYILDMAGENISLDDMAKVAGLSRYHFLRTFTASQGISPHAFLLNRRLQLAKTALKNGAQITEAALKAGFYDQSHLSRRFKAAFGITPRQFQEAIGSPQIS